MIPAPTARKVATRTPTRTAQLRRIHTDARKAGYDTDRKYRAMLENVVGLESMRQATRAEREAVIRHLDSILAYRPPFATPVSDEEAESVLG